MNYVLSQSLALLWGVGWHATTIPRLARARTDRSLPHADRFVGTQGGAR